MKEIYLDNNATTQVAPEVIEEMRPYFDTYYGNPSSLHKKGIEAERAIKNAKQKIAETLHVKTSEIYFTSGATESDNWALKGASKALKNKGRHIVTTKIEHDAVLETCKNLEEDGFKVSYLDVNRDGSVHEDDLLGELTEETIMVSMMHVNNEIGSILPINELATAVKEKYPSIVFFSDGVQALGKLKIDIKNVDAYALSSHKIHGPKGVGLLIVKEGMKIKPFVHGGGQEQGLRSGTQNVPGIVGFSKAIELAYQDLETNQGHFKELKDIFVQGLDEIEDVYINSPESSVPTTVNVGFEGIPAEVILHALEEEGIYASSGSACASGKQDISHVLQAIKVPYAYISSSLRFGFSRYTTKEDIVFTCKVLKNKVEELRKITGK